MSADRTPTERPTERTASDRVGVLDRPPPRDVLLIVLGVSAVSTSAPFIRAAAAPAFAVAFWRNAAAAGVLAPWAWFRNREELTSLHGRERRLALAAGVLLALHFATWIPSLSFTSVASSTALVATQPVWAALIARSQGDRVPAMGWAGIWLAVLGAALLTGIDLHFDARALGGDLLALVGGFFAAAYVTVGAEVRRTVTTTVYTTVCYATCAVLLLGLIGVTRTRFVGFDARTWWCIVGLTVGAQLLGHSVFNVVLKTTSPTVVSISILFEIVGAVALAWAFLDEVPRWQAAPAAAVIVSGVVLVIRAGSRRPAVAGVPVVE
ncbi:MAG TPA: DMT family transporter [Frankiaceae bacterium]|jgi:drug/metabolite transporter (DMT)-like permease|nr:DMT family transporter [Frankiaceae bacterium]